MVNIKTITTSNKGKNDAHKTVCQPYALNNPPDEKEPTAIKPNTIKSLND
ncbi:hypothetical protein OIZ54_05785 [Pseudoalteromonas sp. A3]|nr:hypothetical protein [Pseudoalteromonas sp. A3]MCW1718261.1 hypothetical protein [Pseudoalteromonas sp. A3]